MPDLPLTGHCLCGAVSYEISEPLRNAGYCHCTRCQRRTGTAASAQAGIPRGALTIRSGEELLRAYDPGDGGLPVLKPLEPLELVESLEPVELCRLRELGVLDGPAWCGRDAPGECTVDVESTPPA